MIAKKLDNLEQKPKTVIVQTYYKWTGQNTEKTDFCPSWNTCSSKWSRISRQYLANNSFASAPKMIFTSLS